MNDALVYLDHNATAPLRPEVAALMASVQALPLNPSSVHAYGRKAKHLLNEARRKIAETIGAFPHEIAFSSSATEANNMALRGFPERRVFVSAAEHPSVLWAQEIPLHLSHHNGGILDIGSLDAALRSSASSALVSIQLANNETGVIQPISEIARIVHTYNGLLHVDAVQAFGKTPLDLGVLGADMLTFSAHKWGGPLGAAALVVRGELNLQPLMRGGKQEQGRRPGTENLAAIGGMALAVELSQDDSHTGRLKHWRDAMEAEIAACAPGAVMWGQNAPRLPNTSCVSMPGVGNEVQLMDFDLQGIMVSAGSACSSGRVEASHVLLAMGANEEMAKSAIRVSAGWNTKESDIQRFTTAWKKLYQRLGKSSRNTASIS